MIAGSVIIQWWSILYTTLNFWISRHLCSRNHFQHTQSQVSILPLRKSDAKPAKRAFIILSTPTFELGKCLSPHWAEMSTILFGRTSSCADPLLTPRCTLSGHPLLMRCHGNRHQHCSNTNTLTRLGCLEADHIQGDQDLKCSVTWNWVEEK